MSAPTEILCPHCLARNRIPAGRDPRAGRCGHCHRPLVPEAPVELDEAGFERLVRTSPQPVLVDFHARWCGPCHAMAPALAATARRLEPRVRVVKLDIDRTPRVAARLGIQGVPTLILFKDGREIARQSGAMSQGAIVAFVREALARLEEIDHAQDPRSPRPRHPARRAGPGR